MSTQVSPELRSQIIASIKGGMSIAQAASEHQLTPKTISKWMRDLSSSTRTTINELQRARKRIAFLEHIILDLVLDQKAQTYKG
jgi:transposase-like protein